MDNKLLSKKILNKTKDYALSEYKDRAVTDGPDLFLAKCYAIGYVGALVSEGYEITVKSEKESHKFPKGK